MFDENYDAWSWEEDIIICKFYLDHKSDWITNTNLNNVQEKLKGFGYFKSDNDVRMRLSNYAMIDSKHALASTSVQEKRVFKLLEKI